MKKLARILPVIALAAASVFAFTGCDKILEAFYPEATGGGDGGDGQYGVTFRVNVKTDVHDWGRQIVAILEKGDGTTQQRSGYAYNPPGSDTATWVVTFDYLPDGDYRVFAFLDLNNDYQHDQATEASAGRDWFHLPWWDPQSQQEIDRPEFPVDLVPVAGDEATVKLAFYVDKYSIDQFLGDTDMWRSANLAVELMNMQYQWFPDPVRHGTAVDSDDTSKGLWEVEYNFLPTGTYRLTAWIDANNNSVKEPEELGVFVETSWGQEFPVPFYDPWQSPSDTRAAEFVVWLYGMDPAFSVQGPSSVDRNTPTGYNEFTVYPYDGAASFDHITFRVKNSNTYAVASYWGNSEPISVASWDDIYPSDGNAFTFSVDFTALSPALSDYSWDGASAIVEVTGYYTNGATYTQEFWVGLVDSSTGGTYYDLTVTTTLDQSVPWGYVYVDIYDSTFSSWLTGMGWYGMDSSGATTLSFYGIYDPTDLDQVVRVTVYDQYWNYYGYYDYYLTGEQEGGYTLTLDDWGMFTLVQNY